MLLIAAFLIWPLSTQSLAATAGRLDLIIDATIGNGSLNRHIGTPVLNNNGHIAFETSNLYPLYYSGTFVGDNQGVEQLLHYGVPLPGGETYSGTYNSISAGRINGDMRFRLNQLGEIAFVGEVGGGSSPTPQRSGSFLLDNDELVPLALIGQPSNDSSVVYYYLYDQVFNNDRQVVFRSPLDEPWVRPSLYRPEALFLGEPTGVRTIARAGQLTPDGTMKFARFFAPTISTGGGDPYSPAFASRYTINDQGQVAFLSRLENLSPPITIPPPTNDSGIFLGDGTSLVQIARKGQAIDGSSQVVPDFFVSNYDYSRFQLQLDNSNNVAFRVQTGILRGNGTEIRYVVERNQFLGDDLTRLDNVSHFRMNDSGQITFLAKVMGDDVTEANDFRIYQTDGTIVREIVREGQFAPDGFGTMNLTDLTTFSMNSSGQLAFVTTVNDPRYPTYSATFGLFFYDEIKGLVQVARTRQDFMGMPLNLLGLTRYDTPNVQGFNDRGQIAFWFTANPPFTQPREGIALWTPVPEPSGVLWILVALSVIGRFRRVRN